MTRGDHFKRIKALTISHNSRYDSISRSGEYSPSKNN